MADSEMAKIMIEVFRDKNSEDFSASIADPASRAETGSAAALTAANAAALALRAAAVTAAVSDSERLDYIVRNLDTVRKYMVHLIDEDVKSRGPLRRAIKEGKAQNIEAARQTACCINAEIIGMTSKLFELEEELADICPQEARHFIAESAVLAYSAAEISRLYILNMASYSTDETYRFVIRRENELTFDELSAQLKRIREKTL